MRGARAWRQAAWTAAVAGAVAVVLVGLLYFVAPAHGGGGWFALALGPPFAVFIFLARFSPAPWVVPVATLLGWGAGVAATLSLDNYLHPPCHPPVCWEEGPGRLDLFLAAQAALLGALGGAFWGHVARGDGAWGRRVLAATVGQLLRPARQLRIGLLAGGALLLATLGGALTRPPGGGWQDGFGGPALAVAGYLVAILAPKGWLTPAIVLVGASVASFLWGVFFRCDYGCFVAGSAMVMATAKVTLWGAIPGAVLHPFVRSWLRRCQNLPTSIPNSAPAQHVQ